MRLFTLHFMALTIATAVVSPGAAQDAIGERHAADVLQQAAHEGKYTFLLFFRDDSAPVQTMRRDLTAKLIQRSDQAVACDVCVTAASEQTVVKRFGMSRAPLPLVLAVAPNGAITSISRQSPTDESISRSFVTPATETCLKSMQDGKLVLVYVQSASSEPMPNAVADFVADPLYQARVVPIAVDVADAREAEFLGGLELNSGNASRSTMALLAPPGGVVERFASTASKADLAAALHASGKCCQDPNCKAARSAATDRAVQGK